MFTGDPHIRDRYKKAILSIPGDEAIALLRQYLDRHIGWYDPATAYWFGQVIDRIGRRRLNLDANMAMTYVGQDNYLKGWAYLGEGRLHDIQVHDNILSGIVEGSLSYELWVAFRDDGTIEDSDCSCPVRSKICKHVACLLQEAIHSKLIPSKDPESLDEVLAHL